MGSILERVRGNVEKAGEIEDEGIEMAEQDSDEAGEAKAVIDGMDDGLDEDIMEAREATREAVKEEATDHMESDVHGTLEQGYDIATDAINEGTDQGARSHNAADVLREVTGITDFGSGAADSAATTADVTGDQFEEHAETAEEAMERAEDLYQQLLDRINS